MAELSDHVRDSLHAQEHYLTTNAPILGRAGSNLAQTLMRGNKLITVGCPVVSQHLAAEITGRFQADRPALPAVSLNDNPSALTAIANDYGAGQVYARQLSALAQPGDFVLGFLVPGNSGVKAALDQAQSLGLETLVLEAPGVDEDIATEIFLTAGHLLCEEAEVEMRRLQPEWYQPAPNK